jgi:ABC-type sulfate/molybdate transport systems ATPase subunit
VTLLRLAAEPEVLLLDEPAGLDVQVATAMRGVLRRVTGNCVRRCW